jgi:hypothetical protein
MNEAPSPAPSLQEEVIDLLNRDFQFTDIKEHLLSKGYSGEEIDRVLEGELAEKQRQAPAVGIQVGTKGLWRFVTGFLAIATIPITHSYWEINAVRVVVGLYLMGIGIYRMTRTTSIYAPPEKKGFFR